MKRGILAITVCAFVGYLVMCGLTGCGQNPSTVDPATARDFVDHLTYFKDSRTNVCYATVASRGDFEANQNSFTITYVPCTPEVLAAIK